MSHCPSCGRFVGPYEACPHCGARIGGRLPIRLVKVIAVVLATIGMAILWLAATRSAVPRISIAQAGATTNMAYARIEGWVVRAPTYYPDSGYLAYTLTDESGDEIAISAYRKETDALRAEGRIPALGDRVSVAGTLRVREDRVGLTINVPQHVEVLRPEAIDREIGTLTLGDELTRVRVRGQVWAVDSPYDGLTIVTLRDTSGEIDMAIDHGLEPLTGAFLPLSPGDSVEVLATVSHYRETPQLVPVSPQDIVLLPDPVPIAEPASIGQIRARDASRWVALEGTIRETVPLGGGAKLILADESGEIVVLIWQDTYQALPDPSALVPGVQVRVVGEISIYEGRLEIIPERPVDVTLLAPAAADRLGANTELLPLCDLTAQQIGETVNVAGTVVAVASFSQGFKFTLDDGTGRSVLLLWHAAFDELDDTGGLDLGAQVAARGEVEAYQGQIQIVPRAGADVSVLAPGAVNAPEREIGALAPSDVGQLVTVTGTVSRIEPFSGGRRAWIEDSSGEVMILLWGAIDERLAVPVAPGESVRVTGTVEEYQGTLEIVPRLPGDVRR
jgi:DNA/RNA endonuclease YhcR with UshA esterase domain